MYKFDAVKAVEECTEWIRGFFEENGDGCNAVVGISGGKDSSVTAALLVRALGVSRVVAVLMPNGVQKDIDYSHKVCEHLKINNITVDISAGCKGILGEVEKAILVSQLTRVNLPARLRMSTLYAVSQSLNGRVANTCNLSEDWVGYSTRYGDAAGDFSPLANFTVTEVRELGKVLGLPDVIVQKTPEDGLSGKSDEENLGFTYETLDNYIRQGIVPDEETKAKIDTKRKFNKFKLEMMPMFKWSGAEIAIKE